MKGRSFALLLAVCGVSVAAIPTPSPLAPLVRAYREASTPAGRDAIESFARVHARDSFGALAQFALGVASYENKDYATAAALLAKARPQLAPIADYVTYYLAAAQLAQGDSVSALATLGALQDFLEVKSPLLAKAVILDATIRLKSGGADSLRPAVQALHAQANTFSQPDADFALALANDALGDGAEAAVDYQRVYFMRPATQMAAESWIAMDRLHKSLGTSYPAAPAPLLLERGQRWIDAKEYSKARAEFEAIQPLLTGLERDQARVREGAAQYADGDYRGAFGYLKALDLPKSEAATGLSCHKSEAASEPPGPQPPPGQVWLTAQQVKDAKIEVQVVAEQDVDDTILTSGRVTLEDMQSAHVFTPVTGRVVKIVAGLGTRVKKGDPLAVIESPDIGNAVSDVHKAEADLIAAEHDFKRKKDLFEQKAGSEADQESSEDSWRKARAEVERARQKAYLLRAGNVDSVTQTYTLPSPIDGEVLQMNINPGMEVQGQYTGGTTQELFTVGEIDKLWVLGDLYEMDLARVQIGAPAAVTTVAYKDKVFKGQVDWVSGMLDPNTRTTKVRATFDNPDRLLRPEMFVTVQISVEQKKALAIPRNALLRLGEYKVVFIQVGDDGGLAKFERLPVDVDEGEASPWLEVKHGVEAGQKVVVSGAILLSQKL